MASILRVYRKQIKEIITQADRTVIKIIMSKFEILISDKLGSEHIRLEHLRESRYQAIKKENFYAWIVESFPRNILDISRIIIALYM